MILLSLLVIMEYTPNKESFGDTLRLFGWKRIPRELGYPIRLEFCQLQIVYILLDEKKVRLLISNMGMCFLDFMIKKELR